ncbi:MAG: hypothetical protein WBM14_07285, partial [Terracidiphilus sp.]
MIRQAISCDICGTEKQLTNHWFVAYDLAGELRISGWNSRNRQRAGARHLCGQTCLHKLVDDFMAKAISARVQPAVDKSSVQIAQAEAPRAASTRADASLTSAVAHTGMASPRREARGTDSLDTHSVDTHVVDTHSVDTHIDEFESSARLITPSVPARPVLSLRQSATGLAAVPPEPPAGDDEDLDMEASGFSSRSWRAEAWK